MILIGIKLMATMKTIITQLQKASHQEPLGLYVHIPFCIDNCTYCSFSKTKNLTLKSAVLNKINLQILKWGKNLNKPMLSTMYLGGGTPSLLTIDELKCLTSTINKAFDLTLVEEATIEVNPGTVDFNWLNQVRKLGWDRISMGIQTFDNKLLNSLGRIHDAQTALEAIQLANKAGFDRISSDLMIGIPNQNLNRILIDINTLVNNNITHMSIYMLDIDKNCTMRTAINAGKLTMPNEDEVADVFEMLQEELPLLGFLPYEISSYAIPGQASKHNSRYWQRLPYLGLGPSAASHIGAWRWTEDVNIKNWLKNCSNPVIQKLDDIEMLSEIPLLGLRMHNGINWNQLRAQGQKLNLEQLINKWESKLTPFINHGLVAKNGPMIYLTARGILLSNVIMQLFV